MTWVVMVFVVVGGALVQMLLPAPACVGHVKAPVLLGVVLYYALNREGNVMTTAAVSAGFLKDVLSPMPIGYSIVCFLIVAWVASRFRPLVMNEAAVTAAFFGFVSAAMVTLVVYVLLRQAGLVADPVWLGVAKSFGVALLAAVCTPLVFLLVGKFDRWVGNVEEKHSVAA